MSDTLTIERDGEKWQERSDRLQGYGCHLCGRKCNEATCWWVNVAETGWDEVVLLPVAADPTGEGCFPVGSECAKSIPAAFKTHPPTETGD